MSNDVKFYMQRYVVGSMVYQPKDLEKEFPGLLVSKVAGINDRGKNKNIYTESFVEQNGVNVWMGTPYFESTSVTLTLFFVGDKRQDTFDSFCDYVSTGKLYYWDTYHKKVVTLVLAEPIQIANEEKYGSNPNIEVPVKFTNISGTFTKLIR